MTSLIVPKLAIEVRIVIMPLLMDDKSKHKNATFAFKLATRNMNKGAKEIIIRHKFVLSDLIAAILSSFIFASIFKFKILSCSKFGLSSGAAGPK